MSWIKLNLITSLSAFTLLLPLRVNAGLCEQEFALLAGQASVQQTAESQREKYLRLKNSEGFKEVTQGNSLEMLKDGMPLDTVVIFTHLPYPSLAKEAIEAGRFPPDAPRIAVLSEGRPRRVPDGFRNNVDLAIFQDIGRVSLPINARKFRVGGACFNACVSTTIFSVLERLPHKESVEFILEPDLLSGVSGYEIRMTLKNIIQQTPNANRDTKIADLVKNDLMKLWNFDELPHKEIQFDRLRKENQGEGKPIIYSFDFTYQPNAKSGKRKVTLTLAI